MANCPKCKVEIGTLTWSQNAVRFGCVEVVKGILEWVVDSVNDNGGDEFSCPECGEMLFKGKNATARATAFLKGESK